MDELEELLPGIEHYLTRVLAAEKLSPGAEQRRLYFVERLDILKLPASCPPRPEPRRATPEPLEEENGEGDFAAYQRELSRLTHSNSRPLDDDSDSEKNTVKVYDDIDLGLDDGDGKEAGGGGEGEEEDPEHNLYEIPVCQLQMPPGGQQPQLPVPTTPHSEDSASPLLGGGGDAASLATVASIEDLPRDTPDSPPPRPPSLPPPLPTTMPPPLPPRRDQRASERNSGGGGGGSSGPPDLPARPGSLARRSDNFGSEKSDRSEDHPYDLSDGEDTNYEHCSGEDDDHYNDVKLPKKPDVKLPKREKKKKERRLTQKIRSKVTSMWEAGTPYGSLEDVALSGEFYLRSKLTWTRKVAALSQGNLCCYKPEKLQRPVLMVGLEGYSASWSEKDNKRGYEIRLEHPEAEDYVFSVDFKEWAMQWCEYMNAMAKGAPAPGPRQHLARTFPGCKGSREELNSSKTSLSSCKEDSEKGDLVALETVQELPSKPAIPKLSGATSSTTVAKWDWKTLFYGFAFPLEQLLLTFTRGDVNSSNSNLSLNSDGAGDDFRKPRLRGNKVMRMGSFAYRATQFFENMTRKSTGSSSGRKRLTQSLSSPCDSNGGIEEENSVSSTGNTTVSPSSDTAPVFDEPPENSPLVDTAPPRPLPPSDVKIEGNLNIFSSFNKRRWGSRWCLVRGVVFECYRKQGSAKCELSIDLAPCKLRRAVQETKSEMALMILENDREKITIEPLTEEALCSWVRVLMAVTQTPELPAGLEVYMAVVSEEEQEEQEAERPEDLSYSTINKWGPNSLTPDKSPDSGVNSVASPLSADPKPLPAGDQETQPEETPVGDLYSEVLKKKPSKPLEFQQVAPQLPSSAGDAGTASSGSGAGGEQKNTTDSGFYSVRDNNSDSDSGCEDNESREASNGLSAVQEISDSCCEDGDSGQPSGGHPPADSCGGEVQDTNPESESNTHSASESLSRETQVLSRATENATIPEDLEKSVQCADKDRDSCSGDSQDKTLQESQGHQCNSESHTNCSHPSESLDDPENEYDVVETATEVSFHQLSNKDSVSPSLSRDGTSSDPSRGERSKEQGSGLLSASMDPAMLTSQERLAAINKLEDMCDESKSSADVGMTDLLESWGLDGFLKHLDLHRDYLPRHHGDGGHARTRARRGRGRLVSDPAGERVGQQERVDVATHAHSWFAESSRIPDVSTGGHDQDPFRSRSSLKVTGVERGGLDSVEELSPPTVDVTEKCSAGAKAPSIQDRINRLREKLVNIKRKRIAVRDKRQRASSTGEAERCDAEYKTLEEECQTMEAEIARLEQQQLQGKSDVTSSATAAHPSKDAK